MMHIHHIQNFATLATKRVVNDVPPTDFEVPEGYIWIYSQTEAEEAADVYDDNIPF